jgi:Kef-type K+ transport system membrane component KefB
MSLLTPSVLFFLQVIVILAACRLAGLLMQRLGQPQVIGEMVAGIALGPSLLGWAAPQFQAWLFPKDSLKQLYVLAQFGVGLYMFVVGAGFKRDLLAQHGRAAGAVSIAGMLVPFALGALIAGWLLGMPGMFSPKVAWGEAALFMGAAIAITAFPMLARIIHERGFSSSPLGALALTAGAVDDAVAWCLLALVLASFGGSASIAVLAIGGGAAFTLFMVFVGPKLLSVLPRWFEREGGVITPPLLAATLLAYAMSALVMDVVGIHAVFGGFILGVVMPRGAYLDKVREHLEPITVALLLPFFFTYSGLNTRLDLVNSWQMLGVALVVLAASIAGKGLACYGAARLNGAPHREALAVGALMNARGLMELIILNIGLQRGVIGPELFSIMVLMAVVTTLMATPVFEYAMGKSAPTQPSSNLN